MPAPNFFAGILIGIANQSWLAVIVTSAVWPIFFCAQVSILESERAATTIEDMKTRGRRLIFNSPTITFYAIEFYTGLMTALTVGLITYGIKILVY
jgi:hypothetical protein